MDVKGLGNSTSTVSQFLANLQERKIEVREVESTQARTDLVQAPNAEVKTGNFDSSTDHSSTRNYARATMEGKRAAGAQALRQQALLNSAMAQSANATSNAERTLAGKRAARSVMQEMQQSTMQASKRNLEEGSQSIHTAAEEAVQGEAAVSNDATAQVAAASPAAPEIGTGSSSSSGAPQSIDIAV